MLTICWQKKKNDGHELTAGPILPSGPGLPGLPVIPCRAVEECYYEEEVKSGNISLQKISPLHRADQAHQYDQAHQLNLWVQQDQGHHAHLGHPVMVREGTEKRENRNLVDYWGVELDISRVCVVLNLPLLQLGHQSQGNHDLQELPVDRTKFLSQKNWGTELINNLWYRAVDWFKFSDHSVRLFCCIYIIRHRDCAVKTWERDIASKQIGWFSNL